MQDNGIIRQFDTGATRDSEEGKNDYEGFYHPLVIEAFGDYMTEHRKQSDGKLRESDNWQKGIPTTAYIKSLIRHVIDVWFIYRKIRRFDKKTGKEITMKDALCAVLFNAQGLLFNLLTGKEK